MTPVMERIAKEYNVIEISEGFYRTLGGRAYIITRDEDYTISSCNGRHICCASNFRLACIRANEV